MDTPLDRKFVSVSACSTDALRRHPSRGAWTILTILTGLFLFASACAGPQRPRELPEASQPFLHYARRETVLLVHWKGDLPPPAVQEAFARRLEIELEKTYRSPVTLRSSPRPYPGLSPSLLTELVRVEIDDAVVVEATALEGERIQAAVRVIGLATQDIVEAFVLPPSKTNKPALAGVQTYAEDIVYMLSRQWTRPNQVPPMDALLAANNLFARKACAHAVPVYNLALDHRWPSRTDLISEYTDAVHRRELCKQKLQRDQLLREDKDARFTIRVQSTNIHPRLVQRLERSIAETNLAGILSTRTKKPVYIEIDNTHIVTSIRYRRGVRGLPRVDRSEETPIVDLSPLQAVMDALLTAQAKAADRSQEEDAAKLRSLTLELRLTQLLGDNLSFVFASVNGQARPAPMLFLRHQGETYQLPSRERSALRDSVFVLGPEFDFSKRRTQDGLVVSFFESDPPEPPSEPQL